MTVRMHVRIWNLMTGRTEGSVAVVVCWFDGMGFRFGGSNDLSVGNFQSLLRVISECRG
jgi:hypothetical protein